jgi:hypothetical protein
MLYTKNTKFFIAFMPAIRLPKLDIINQLDYRFLGEVGVYKALKPARY